MLNHIVVMGRLTRDPELRTTQTGTPVVSFTVAVDRDFADRETGARQTDFIDVVAWRNTAEFISRNFNKGKMAIVLGRHQIRDWTDKEGQKRRSAEIVADTVYFGESRQAEEARMSSYGGGYSSQGPQSGYGGNQGGGYAAQSGYGSNQGGGYSGGNQGYDNNQSGYGGGSQSGNYSSQGYNTYPPNNAGSFGNDSNYAEENPALPPVAPQDNAYNAPQDGSYAPPQAPRNTAPPAPPAPPQAPVQDSAFTELDDPELPF
jgi:single-strand DNA-binding protein